MILTGIKIRARIGREWWSPEHHLRRASRERARQQCRCEAHRRRAWAVGHQRHVHGELGTSTARVVDCGQNVV